MRKKTDPFDEFLERSGLKAKWIAEGEAKGIAEAKAEGKLEVKLETARTLITMGYSLEKIVTVTELPLKTILALI
jgi:hypothetical protein